MVSKRDAFLHGKSTGEELAYFNLVEHEYCYFDDLLEDVAECEENARQYSPFEFTASDFNDSRDPDTLWDAYDEGVRSGARQAWLDWKKKGNKSQSCRRALAKRASRKGTMKTTKPRKSSKKTTPANFGGIKIRRVF